MCPRARVPCPQGGASPLFPGQRVGRSCTQQRPRVLLGRRQRVLLLGLLPGPAVPSVFSKGVVHLGVGVPMLQPSRTDSAPVLGASTTHNVVLCRNSNSNSAGGNKKNTLELLQYCNTSRSCRIFPLRDWISDPGWGNPVATVGKRSFLPFFHSLDVLRGSAPFEMQILRKLQTL